MQTVPVGLMSELPKPSIVACERSRTFVLEGFEAALHHKQRKSTGRVPKLDGEAEAKLLPLRLSKSPAGYGRWTLRLLAEELVDLEVVDSISHEIVRQTRKKNGMTTTGRVCIDKLSSSFTGPRQSTYSTLAR